ncbi:ABC-type transport auxiliary lipoprotein family protein [Paraburkholderia franconis]|uniref:ABC-type transport auxiliary lipoprotein family protein n=1 Tax=Paraburkholderia franconis TaxID=2654983 RepID=UPI002AB2C9FB|nr:ABC-type transport auxiliary lipoprotein family protein [Paraburkholderia franconis]
MLIDRSPEQKRLAAQQHEHLVEIVMLGHSGESAGVFIFLDAPAPPDTRMLVVTVLDAETDASGMVKLQASWTLQSGQPARATLTQQAKLKATLENRGAAAQAAALSRISRGAGRPDRGVGRRALTSWECRYIPSFDEGRRLERVILRKAER